MQSAINNKQ